MKLGTALRLGRISNLPTIWTNVLAGLVLAGAAPSPVTYGVLALAMSLFYVGGMYLNDAFDREIDARLRPERPIPSGEVGAGKVFGLGFAMLGLGMLLVACLATRAGLAAHWRAIASAAALLSAIVYYDARHKQNPLGPIVMGLCRALVYVTAAACVVVTPPARLWLGGAALLSYVFGLTYAAKQENLARVGSAWPLAFLALPLLGAAGAGSAVSLGLYAAFALWALHAVSFVLRKKGRDIGRAVGYSIAGISLLDGALVASRGEEMLGVACVGGFALTLWLQRPIAGT